MPNAGLEPVHLAIGRDVGAKAVRGFGLADAGNIVVLALDGHQRDALDHRGVDTLAAMLHAAQRQGVADENGVHGLQVIFRCEIHHGEILIVEFAMFLHPVAVAAHQMAEQIAVRFDVTVEIHADEAVKLQETPDKRRASCPDAGTAPW